LSFFKSYFGGYSFINSLRLFYLINLTFISLLWLYLQLLETKLLSIRFSRIGLLYTIAGKSCDLDMLILHRWWALIYLLLVTRLSINFSTSMPATGSNEALCSLDLNSCLQASIMSRPCCSSVLILLTYLLMILLRILFIRV